MSNEISNELRVNQMTMIDVYLEAAKDDENLRIFLGAMKDKIENGLKELKDGSKTV